MKNINKKFLIFAALALGIFMGGFLLWEGNSPHNQQIAADSGIASRGTITMYKSAQCGCCVRYAAYLKEQSFDVAVEVVDNIQSIKNYYQIPRNMQSCHTAVMGDYFIEGHVPIEAIDKLLEERPQINGIALSGMPAGSPGMGGLKTRPFVIYSLTEGEPIEFLTL